MDTLNGVGLKSPDFFGRLICTAARRSLALPGSSVATLRGAVDAIQPRHDTGPSISSVFNPWSAPAEGVNRKGWGVANMGTGRSGSNSIPGTDPEGHFHGIIGIDTGTPCALAPIRKDGTRFGLVNQMFL